VSKSEKLIVWLESSQICGHFLEGVKARLGIGEDLHQQFERHASRSDRAILCHAQMAAPTSIRSVSIFCLPTASNGRLGPSCKAMPRTNESWPTFNASHLLGRSVPRHVFFDVTPIDNRLTTLEDGESWPLLLTQYRLVGHAGTFLVLDRSPGASLVLQRWQIWPRARKGSVGVSTCQKWASRFEQKSR
jgi:hypothetical protein